MQLIIVTSTAAQHALPTFTIGTIVPPAQPNEPSQIPVTIPDFPEGVGATVNFGTDDSVESSLELSQVNTVTPVAFDAALALFIRVTIKFLDGTQVTGPVVSAWTPE